MALSSLWTIIKEYFDKDHKKTMDFWPIDPGRIVDEKPPLKPRTLEAGATYVRLRLAQMFLKKEVEWISRWQPAVNSLVRLEAGDQPALEVPNIADATRIGIKPTDAGALVAKNFVLTPTLPFNGNLLHLSAGLMAIEGQNYLKNALQILGDFANLLNATQLSSVLNVVQPLALGIQNVFKGGNTQMHLGIHNSYSAGQLDNGYLVAVRATEQQLPPSEVWVVGGQLRRGRGPDPAQMVPLEGFDYLLIRVEVFEQRDDWEKLSAIEEPFQEAVKALHDPATQEQAPQYLRTALLKARLAPELTQADRRRVVQSLKDQYEEVKKDMGTAKLRGSPLPTLKNMMKGGLSVKAALQEGEPTVEEIFALTR